MKNRNFFSPPPLYFLTLFSYLFLVFGCTSDEVVPIPEDGLAMITPPDEEEIWADDGGIGPPPPPPPYEGTCECYYQILDVYAEPAPGGGDPNGGPDYYFHGGLPTGNNNDAAGFCPGTTQNCQAGEECYGFSAYGSVNPSGCQCYDPINCEDFIYDDLDDSNGSPYPTQFFPFNCNMPLFSDIIVEWECLWYSQQCTGQHTVKAPSYLAFKIMCIDPSPLPPGCTIPGQANVSDTIIVQMTQLSQFLAKTTIELTDCGCTPIEK